MQDMQEDIVSFTYWRTAVKSHAEGKKHASSVKESQGTESVSDFFKKKEVSTKKCRSEKSGETSSGLAFSRKTEQESSQLKKIGFEERATQSWDLVGTGVSNVTFLLQFSLWCCWCIQGYVSRQHHCSRNELWANKTVILDPIWNCTLLQAVTGWGYKKGSMFCSVI